MEQGRRPPRSLSGLRPQSYQLLGEEKQTLADFWGSRLEPRSSCSSRRLPASSMWLKNRSPFWEWRMDYQPVHFLEPSLSHTQNLCFLLWKAGQQMWCLLGPWFSALCRLFRGGPLKRPPNFDHLPTAGVVMPRARSGCSFLFSCLLSFCWGGGNVLQGYKVAIESAVQCADQLLHDFPQTQVAGKRETEREAERVELPTPPGFVSSFHPAIGRWRLMSFQNSWVAPNRSLLKSQSGYPQLQKPPQPNHQLGVVFSRFFLGSENQKRGSFRRSKNVGCPAVQLVQLAVGSLSLPKDRGLAPGWLKNGFTPWSGGG